jgi:hypothetical protein
VIRRPLVGMALAALRSVACQGEQAATPPAATSSPSHRGRSQPSAFANAWPLCPVRISNRSSTRTRAGASTHQHNQTKEETPTFDLRPGAVIDGGDGVSWESPDPMDRAWRHTDRRHHRSRQPRPRQLRRRLWFEVFNRNDVYDNDIHDILNWGPLRDQLRGTKIHDDTLRDKGGDDRYDRFQRGSTPRGRLRRCHRQRGESQSSITRSTARHHAVGLIVNGNRPLTRGVCVHDNSVTFELRKPASARLPSTASSIGLVRRRTIASRTTPTR